MMSAMRRQDEEIRVLHYLAAMVRLSGKTHKEIDRELSWCRGTTSQVLAGRIQLKFRHILEILDVCAVATGFFFETVFPGHRGGLRWPEAGVEPAANMAADLSGQAAARRRPKRPSPPDVEPAIRMQQLFEELAARLPDFVAMHEDLAIERARREPEIALAKRALPKPKKKPPVARSRRPPSRKD